MNSSIAHKASEVVRLWIEASTPKFAGQSLEIRRGERAVSNWVKENLSVAAEVAAGLHESADTMSDWSGLHPERVQAIASLIEGYIKISQK